MVTDLGPLILILDTRSSQDELEQAEQLEDSLAALQGLIGEAIGYGFSELRQSLDSGKKLQHRDPQLWMMPFIIACFL